MSRLHELCFTSWETGRLSKAFLFPWQVINIRPSKPDVLKAQICCLSEGKFLPLKNWTICCTVWHSVAAMFSIQISHGKMIYMA